MNSILHPDSPALRALCEYLAERAQALDAGGLWPEEQLAALAQCGVFRWFVPAEYGGVGWNAAQLAQGYIALGQACLTTAFVLTQWAAACARIASSPRESLRQRLLPELARGDYYVTVAISHLTTSRRHLVQPILRAADVPGGFVLDGESHWVTGATHARLIVVGATLPDGRQLLCAVPADRPGITIRPPEKLVALNASQTGSIALHQVRVTAEEVLAGPVENVMRHTGGGTGGAQTSALALGHAAAAIGWLEDEASRRPDLARAAAALRAEWSARCEALSQLAEAPPQTAAGQTAERVRAEANSLALRAAHSALAAAKGAGFAARHPAGRWCRESLFFLVWSCPRNVAAANLCEMAGVGWQ